jgi:outer membrane protein assembly factor BamB
MAFDKARVLLAAGSVLGLAACGSVVGQHAQSGPASTRAHATQAGGTCGPLPPRYAWAVDVTTAGRMLWKTPLATTNTYSPSTVPPVAVGPVAVFAQDGIVHGLDQADGRPLWSWAGGQEVYGMWRRGGLVAVLTDQVSNHSRLTGLDAATGAVRWRLRLPARGLYGGQVLTADGGVAMVAGGGGGVLMVVNLTDGRVRWHRAAGTSPALVAADGTVIYGVNGRLTGYDDRTGQRRWTTAGGLPQEPTAQVAGGLVLVTSDVQGPGIPTAMTAVIPATGRIAWRFDRGEALTVLSAGPAGLTLAAYAFNRRLYLLDPRTGRLRWQADTFVAQDTIPLVTKTDVLVLEGLQTVRLVDRAAADGRVRWQAPVTDPSLGGQPVVRAGSLAVVQGEPSRPRRPAPLLAYQTAGGKLAWRADMPAFVQPPPVLVPGGILVQSADPLYACAAGGAGALRTGAGNTTAGPAGTAATR